MIVHAFEQWGIDCLHRFRGMFALRDLGRAATRELWLVRDRIGIKPLYYSVHDGRLVFASEIKALLQDPDQPRAVDEELVLPLPVVSHHARAADAVRGHPQARRRGHGCGSRATARSARSGSGTSGTTRRR